MKNKEKKTVIILIVFLIIIDQIIKIVIYNSKIHIRAHQHIY